MVTFEFYKISKISDTIIKIIGFILSVLTLSLMYWFFYSNFFEREDYINKKRFLKWLKNNSLPQVETLGNGTYYWRFNNLILYLWNKKEWSLHSMNSNYLIGGFHFGLQDTRNSNKVLSILNDIVTKYK